MFDNPRSKYRQMQNKLDEIGLLTSISMVSKKIYNFAVNGEVKKVYKQRASCNRQISKLYNNREECIKKDPLCNENQGVGLSTIVEIDNKNNKQNKTSK